MQDKIGKYFKHYLDDFVFIEFTENYITKSGKIDFMKGVPVPVGKEAVEAFVHDEGLKFDNIAGGMIYVIGVDMNFKYRDKYIEFMKVFNFKILKSIIKQGLDLAEEEKLEEAAIHLRAALVIEPDNLDAIYNYGRVCRHLYAKSEDAEFIMDFKAEATWALEMTVEKHPNFAQAYYFLGFQYANANLYIKAQLVWQQFLRYSKHFGDKKEIRAKLKYIEKFVRFEQGYTAIERGHWQEGIALLEPIQNEVPDWWNLYFFLGVGYSRMNRTPEAIEMFKKVLAVKPSQHQTMLELAFCYEQVGDKQNADKYRKKAELVEPKEPEKLEKPNKPQKQDKSAGKKK